MIDMEIGADHGVDRLVRIAGSSLGSSARIKAGTTRLGYISSGHWRWREN
jgi:hypothetical protein